MEPHKSKIKILLVEDDPTLARLLRLALEDIAELTISEDQSFILSNPSSTVWDIIILDIFLSKNNGIEILKKLREKGFNSPIIIISARATSKNQILSFEYGANLFHPKPINLTLLRTQIFSLIKKSRSVIRINDIVIYLTQGVVASTKNPKSVRLTKKEKLILSVLIEADGEIVSREKLVGICNPRDKDLNFNSIDTTISRLRNKLSPIGGSEIIETAYGSGYRFKNPS